MPDDTSKRGGQDRERISLNEDYEVKDWSRKFGVSTGELVNAVEQVGNHAKDVQDFLERQRKNYNSK